MAEEHDSGWPAPDPAGRFLLVMADENEPEEVFVRRYASEADAVSVSVNYLGGGKRRLFVIDAEVDLDAKAEAFIDSIEF